MVKHKRWSDNQRDSDKKIEKSDVIEISDSQEEPRDIRSILLSGIKYVYIVALAALLSGIFTPLTTGVELTEVIYGILSILLGLAGGILIFLAIKQKKLTTVLVCGGIAIIFTSFIIIHELAERSLF